VQVLARFYFYLERENHLAYLEENDLFDYFRKYFGYETTEPISFVKLQRLTNFLGFDEHNELGMLNKFRRLFLYHVWGDLKANIDLKDFFVYFKKVFDFDINIQSNKAKFNILKKYLYIHHQSDQKIWDELHELFNKTIDVYLNENFEDNLENLKKIILFYSLCDETQIPEDINDCKQFMRENLFANIYDYASKMTTRFATLKELSDYSLNSELNKADKDAMRDLYQKMGKPEWEIDQILERSFRKIYPIALAKQEFSYFILLREIIGDELIKDFS
jgi:hypothetical protein